MTLTCSDCPATLASTNKTGRCHLCATRGSNGTRCLPADFAEHAPFSTNPELQDRYNCCGDIITRWRREAGIPSKKCRRDSDPAPAGFSHTAPTMTKAELRAHYHRGGSTIDRWLKETGVMWRRKLPVVPVRVPRKIITANVNRASHAADFLRRFGPVVRCNSTGTFDPRGDHWRRGSKVLCADEIIARAERQGFNPDAWKELRAA
jgi:hypothetical protein